MTEPSPWASPAGAPADPAATPFGQPAPPAAAPPPVPPVVPPAAPAAPPAAPAAPAQVPASQPNPYGPPPGAWAPPPAPPGQTWAPPPPAQGWTPPPKPGLIPLRPLTLGPLLSASFQVMRRNPRPTFGLSLLLSGGVSVLALLISGLILVLAFARIASAAPGDQDEIAAGATGIAFVSLLIPIGVSIAAFAILQGVISLEVARGTVGEKLKLRGLLRLARGRIWALIGWSILLLAAVVVGILLIVLVTVAVGVAFGTDGILAAGLLGFLLGAGLLVVGIWLGVKTSLVPSILMMERVPLRAALARSWRLTDRFFWRTLGIQALVVVIINTAVSIASQPVAFIGFLIIGLSNPMEDPEAFVIGTLVVYFATLAITLILSAIGLIVQSSATALIYIDLRMRKEGLDVELVRFVEARQAGDTSVPDPYLPRTGAPTGPPAGAAWT